MKPLRLGIIASALSGEQDPLAGLSFALRLQTHNGDNVPLGLYQDEAGTIPAVTEFDLVAALKDELGGSGLVLTQSDPDKRMVLRFNGGVPWLEPDGVDDYYEIASVAGMGSDNFSIIVAAATTSLSGYRAVCSAGSDANASGYAIEQTGFGLIAFLRNGVAHEPTTADWVVNANTVVSVVCSSGTTTLYANGAILSPTYGNPINPPAAVSYVGWDGGNSMWNGPIYAVLWFNRALSDADRALVENYLINEILP